MADTEYTREQIEAAGFDWTDSLDRPDEHCDCHKCAAFYAALHAASPQEHSDHPRRHWDRTCPACNPAASLGEQREPELTVRAIAEHIDGWRSATFGWQDNPDPVIAERNKQAAIQGHAAECLRRIHAALAASPASKSAGDPPGWRTTSAQWGGPSDMGQDLDDEDDAGGGGEMDGTPYLGHYASAEDGVTVTEHPAEPHCRVEENPLTSEQRKALSVTRDVTIPGQLGTSPDQQKGGA
jgi:hypothetical protein